MRCLFVSDLHGHVDRFRKLFAIVAAERPALVLIGGDILPAPGGAPAATGSDAVDFVADYLTVELLRLADALGADYPAVMVILGNDDPRFQEASVLHAAARGVWTYVHDRKLPLGDVTVYGYACVPPTPFRLKDWERYDVSRYVDPGSVSPEEGVRSVPVRAEEVRYGTIARDLERLCGDDDLERAVMLFHSPPYRTALDRAALDGVVVDHAPLDVHVGSIAIQRFIVRRQPLVTLHGHVHESARLTGSWRDRIGRTHAFSAAHDGPELALVRFDTDTPDAAERELV